MAGSYNQVIENDGNLGSNEHVVDMLENGGDVFEGVEEMFGMIWYLASKNVGTWDHEANMVDQKVWVDRVKGWVEEAQKNYKKGLEISKVIHQISPDQRRDNR